MKKKLLMCAAIAVVLMVNVLLSVNAQAVSRTTTTELGGVGRTVEEAIGNAPQVLGASRVTSPRTGDDFWLMVIVVAGLVAIGAVVLLKKLCHD